jgi:hypothetical protein
MLPPRIEHERPAEWLRWLAESPDGYRHLASQAGGLARAAYRLASARCRVHGDGGAKPTLRELQAAALMLGAQLGDSVPVMALLANDCEEQGLVVIRPLGNVASANEPLERAS